MDGVSDPREIRILAKIYQPVEGVVQRLVVLRDVLVYVDTEADPVVSCLGSVIDRA